MDYNSRLHYHLTIYKCQLQRVGKESQNKIGESLLVEAHNLRAGTEREAEVRPRAYGDGRELSDGIRSPRQPRWREDMSGISAELPQGFMAEDEDAVLVPDPPVPKRHMQDSGRIGLIGQAPAPHMRAKCGNVSADQGHSKADD